MIDSCFELNCNWVLNARGSPFCSGTDFEKCIAACIGSTPQITTIPEITTTLQITTTERMIHK